ncbi:hypothetical protein FA15DRAFT_220295 [Coprinopsis marcescibilis]|uniref:Uncharacterized protein n=1 Tax=Coprinopsis marcescibilis TaxID=230819 RepID=A0A5C3L3Z2_COPMA|nr:hypothetical protein FA15DRAFT_220295 [Coprinopsis marcescibilis]
MSAAKALEAKNKGNQLFKEGKLEQSIRHYAEATKLDPTSAVYPSNLSAALYETGQYAACVEAVLESWSRKPDQVLSKKLSSRLAKAIVHGIRDGSINSAYVRDHERELKDLKDICPNDAAWQPYENIESQLGNFEGVAVDARRRFSKLPILKGSPDPRLTFFVMGTDEIISLTEGWGDDEKDPLDFAAMKSEQLEKLAFLVGGVGDAKIAFGTVIGLKDSYDKLSHQKQEHFKAHLVFLDHHFATVARDLLMFMFLDQLRDCQMDPTTRLEIMATLVYLYIGWMMPSYCYGRWISAVKDLKERLTQSPPRLPSFIHVDRNSIPAIMRALNHWLKEPMSTTRFVSYMDHIPRAEGMANIRIPGFPDPIEFQTRQATQRFKSLSVAEMKKYAAKLGATNIETAQQAKRFVEQNKDAVIKRMVDCFFDKNIDLDLVDESNWFKATKIHVPPRALWDRHSGMDLFKSSPYNQTKLRQMAKTVLQTWKPNMSIFDGTHDTPDNLQLDMLMTTQFLANYLIDHGLEGKIDEEMKKDSPAFAYTSAFFEVMVDSINDLGDKLNIEFVCEEIHQSLAKMKSGADDRNPNFPRQFTRIWMSNIPDYSGGTINTITYALPALQKDVPSSLASNCMFNAIVWSNDDEFCYNYTMLLPHELKRFLGVNTLKGKPVQDIFCFGASAVPKPLSLLPTRDEFRNWLTRLLLSFVHPGFVQPRPRLIRLPNSLVAFIGLLSELRNIGYPGHWISDFMQNVINNTVDSDHAVFQETLPRPVTERRKLVPVHRVRLDPWLLEFESLLASANEGLPFTVLMPEGMATRSEQIGQFQATVHPNYTFNMLYNFDPVAALVFYKSLQDAGVTSIQSLTPRIPKIIHGEVSKPAPGDFYVFTSTDFVDVTQCEVRWRMGKASAKKMIREKWSMAVFRMDLWVPITNPVPASQWAFIA